MFLLSSYYFHLFMNIRCHVKCLRCLRISFRNIFKNFWNQQARFDLHQQKTGLWSRSPSPSNFGWLEPVTKILDGGAETRAWNLDSDSRTLVCGANCTDKWIIQWFYVFNGPNRVGPEPKTFECSYQSQSWSQKLHVWTQSGAWHLSSGSTAPVRIITNHL